MIINSFIKAQVSEKVDQICKSKAEQYGIFDLKYFMQLF
mgnify:CR=1 FL=1